MKIHSDYHALIGFTKYGMEFGYPPCCIAEFVQAYVTGAYKIRPKRKFHGTGFVPCKTCNKKTQEQLLSEIAARRVHALPFPKHK